MLEGLGRRAGLRSSSGHASRCPRLANGHGRRQLVVNARSPRYDRRKPPPPDLPSLLFDQRIVYLGMPLVPAVTELMVAELLYLEKQGATLPIEMLINSSGTTRQDGEILAFDSEGVALTSTMGFVKNPISTVNMGLAVGWSCVVLSFGRKGWRKSLPHSLAMIQQPRVPPTGQRQAIEVHIKWREVLDYKRELLRMFSIGTGMPVDKLDAVGAPSSAAANADYLSQKLVYRGEQLLDADAATTSAHRIHPPPVPA
ncbi:ATP-dependent Clp protease proteolytic subunit-related protein 3, chloroplastic [Tetrabaena socialis]|uniref:ATP-dependent Clp protease proteolytic subunit n=1 Tax=Tetrabaena socialis TaxID=47790 RepID=A0A2J8AEW4_9CHLO|nr:ATP-dependent Clp protease proteolytic subunit-related protein 3, chloroplastic [Tetrabaena socialis]|eukprot:PNH11063.1 ATP-dependent Clp protease proteolytic subunit-related protein 3, chloroplastic [Tetrabaena socialis]